MVTYHFVLTDFPTAGGVETSNDAFRSLTSDWQKLLNAVVHLGSIRSLSPSRFKTKLQALGLGVKKHSIGVEVELFIAETYHSIYSLENFNLGTGT